VTHAAGTARARWRRRADVPARDDEGASPVELAIVALGMIVLTFAVVQVGLVFYARSVAHAAATQAVNAARGYGASDEAGRVKARAFLDQAGTGLRDQVVTITRVGNDITVTVSGSAVSVLPGLSFGIEQSAHGSVERVT
jgi:Flp pilus assembly protein TadG